MTQQMQKPDLSVVMIAMNEQDTIGEALAAVLPIAREIIVVDSGSEDSTGEIARALGARVVHRDWQGYANQKNFALSLASCKWVLNIDADEILTPELVMEIMVVLAQNNSAGPYLDGAFVGFKLPRVLHIQDTPVWFGGYYPDAQLRLIKKNAGQFNNRLVHESICPLGPVSTLRHHMIHKAYKTTLQYEQSLERYARLSAQEFTRQPHNRWRACLLNQWLHPLWTFTYRYVLRAGFMDGLLGLKLACIYSKYVLKKIRYLREQPVDG